MSSSHVPGPPPRPEPRQKPEPQGPDLMHQGLQWLEWMFSPKGAQSLVGIGLFCALFSALPLLDSLGSNGLAVVMLLYSLGIWGGGSQLRHAFPWTGKMLLGLAVTAVPLNYLALASLDPGPLINKLFCLLALALLPTMAWRGLRHLLPGRVDPLYVLLLAALGCCSTFLPGLASPLMARGLDPAAFALASLGLSGGLLGLGLLRLGSRLWIMDTGAAQEVPEGHDNLAETLLLSGLLLMAWCAGTSLYTLPGETWALALLLPSAALLGLGGRLRGIAALVLGEQVRRWPSGWRAGLVGCDAAGGTLACLAVAAGWQQPLPGFIAASVMLYLGAAWRGLRWPLWGLSLSGFGLVAWRAGTIQAGAAAALELAALALVMSCLLRLPLLSRPGGRASWRLGCQSAAGLLALASWLQLTRFEAWSGQSLAALTVLTLVSVLAALYLRRSLAGYLSVATGLAALLYAIGLVEPLRSLESWRWLALLLALGMLGCGWLIERLSPGGVPQKQAQPVVQVRGRLGRIGQWCARELPDPYRFRQRFVSPLPYLFAEPLYNFALLLLTGAWLLEIGDLSFSAAAAACYALVFRLYPSRLWTYLVLISLSDGLIGLSRHALPERFQSWSLVTISLGWFFAGILIEELLEARDRARPEAEHEAQKRLVRPFFHAALAVNGLMLHRLFGEVQSAAGSEDWSQAAWQALPMLLSSGLYLLRLRVSVSKLWFYPGMISLTLGFYFGLGGLLRLEAHLLLLSLVAWGWAGMGWLWRGEALQAWWRELIAHRLGSEPLPAHYVRAHLERPEGPFFTMALLAGGVSLAFSWLLIPAQLLHWEHMMPISLLTRVNPLLLDLCQFLNLGLLALLCARGLPAATARQRLGLDTVMLLSLSSCLLWLGRWQLSLETLSLGLTGLALLWQLVALACGERTSPGFRRCLEVGVGILAAGGLLTLPLGQVPVCDLIGLGLLALLCLLQLRHRARPWQVYGLSLCWLGILWQISADSRFYHPISGPMPDSVAELGMALAVGGLSLLSLDVSLRQKPEGPRLSPHLHGLALGHLLCVAACLPLALMKGPNLANAGLLAGALTLLAAQARVMGSLQPMLAPACLAALCLLLSWQPWLAPVALAAQLPLLSWSGKQPRTGEFFPALRLSALAAPVLLQLPVLLSPPPAGAWLPFWQSGHLLAASGLYLWLALRGGEGRRHAWWGVAGLANLAWGWGFWQAWGQYQPIAGGSLMTMVHASLLPPGLSLLLLAHYLLRRQPEKDQLTYFGLSLLLLTPLSLLGLRGSGLPKPLLLAELLLSVILLLVLAARWRRRALLYTGLSLALCLGLGLVGGLLLYGSPWMRWCLCLGLGLSLAAGGLFVQQRSDRLRWLLKHWRETVVSWR